MKIAGGAARLQFTHLGGGLVAKGGAALGGFVIAGADKKFVPAAARIDGDTIVVSSAEVAAPVAVRYAWVNFPRTPTFTMPPACRRRNSARTRGDISHPSLILK